MFTHITIILIGLQLLRGLPIKLPSDKIVPLPQSGHQGLIVASQEFDMLPGLAKLPFQTVALKRSLVSKA